mmetsp:Transcript_118149/g.205220  ORF Transcript_118149/g.205220 Transcript_118149/m.205220 type:complete len:83 (-) Transcript_118149:152-400(-)
MLNRRKIINPMVKEVGRSCNLAQLDSVRSFGFKAGEIASPLPYDSSPCSPSSVVLVSVDTLATALSEDPEDCDRALVCSKEM